ncbi:kelch repeat-containing protein [Planctomycetota bacterium]
MSTKTNRKKCLIVVAAFLCSAGSNAKASFASGALDNVAVAVASVSLATADTWKQKADMPTGRLGHGTSIVDGKIYAIGGYARGGAPGMRTVEEYDPATDTWTTKADMPTGRHWLSTSVVNGKIYAIGGSRYEYTGISVVEEYDPVTDTWTQKASMPTPRNGHVTSVVDGMIYAIGGSKVKYTQPLRTVEAYDPQTDTWTTKADMHTGRLFPSTGAVDGKIYVIGGGGSTANEIFSTVEEYDPATDTWTTIANMPEPRCCWATTVVNEKIYLFGGRNGDNISSTVEEYDPATNTWTRKSDLPERRAGAGSSAVNGRIYVIGGASVAAVHPGVRTVYEYDTGLTIASPDINGDGIVDSADICIMVDHWHTDYPLCDIAPPPFEDGIVDVQDLILLAEYLFQDVNDPTLIAHWALDEEQGIIAADSVSENGYSDGIVIGDPVWQPTGGQVNGAIQLDGVDDFVITNPVLNPAVGSFSILAWVKGGTAGQVIISDPGGTDWLSTDPLEGYLMTELTSGGRYGAPLLSETTIDDGQWHRIGFVWDGSNRTLYVDSLAVAQDMQDSLEGSGNGLYIGTGKDMVHGTYFSGLIDDIRIYNRAIHP